MPKGEVVELTEKQIKEALKGITTFSYNDIKTFTNTASISTIVAVGNAGKIFVINKTSQYDCKGILSFMDNTAIKFAQKNNNRHHFKAYQDATAIELLKNISNMVWNIS